MELWVAIVGMLGTAFGAGGIVKIVAMVTKKSKDDWSKQYIKRLETKLDKAEKKIEDVQEHVIELTVENIHLKGEARRCPMENEECLQTKSES